MTTHRAANPRMATCARCPSIPFALTRWAEKELDNDHTRDVRQRLTRSKTFASRVYQSHTSGARPDSAINSPRRPCPGRQAMWRVVRMFCAFFAVVDSRPSRASWRRLFRRWTLLTWSSRTSSALMVVEGWPRTAGPNAVRGSSIEDRRFPGGILSHQFASFPAPLASARRRERSGTRDTHGEA